MEKEDIRLGLMTTWGSSCGIATYSEELSEALVKCGMHPPVILAPQEATSDRGPRTNLEYCWTRQIRAPYVDLTMMAVAKHNVNLVHIQHEHGLFQYPLALMQTIRALRKAGVRVIITMHTVNDYGGSHGSGLVDQIRRNADCIIVHTHGQYASVVVARGDAPIVRVPHGTKIRRTGDRDLGFDVLGVPRNKALREAVWCLAFGFQGPGKNILGIVRSFNEAKARRLFNNCGLIVCGEAKDPSYFTEIAMEVALSGNDSVIYQKSEFINEENVPHVMAAASFGMLSTRSYNYSSSGQVHVYAGCGVPLAVASRPIYADAINAGAIPFYPDDNHNSTLSQINAMASLALSPELREEVSMQMKGMAAATEWELVAEHHLGLYLSILNGRDVC
jgi:glycosyltransferase involved in cell wall biosynthesis